MSRMFTLILALIFALGSFPEQAISSCEHHPSDSQAEASTSDEETSSESSNAENCQSAICCCFPRLSMAEDAYELAARSNMGMDAEFLYNGIPLVGFESSLLRPPCQA